jgi:hypothetical protein
MRIFMPNCMLTWFQNQNIIHFFCRNFNETIIYNAVHSTSWKLTSLPGHITIYLKKYMIVEKALLPKQAMNILRNTEELSGDYSW